jgi:hypothetical protein
MNRTPRATKLLSGLILWLALAPSPARGEERLWKQYMDAARGASEREDQKEVIRLIGLALEEAEDFGEADPRFLGTLDLMASAHIVVTGDIQASEPYQERSLRIKEKAWGQTSARLAEPLNVMALTYAALGKLDEARVLCLRAMWIQSTDPQADPQVAGRNLGLLANLCGESEDCAEYAGASGKLVGGLEKRGGAPDDAVAMMLDGYAKLLRAGGRKAEAKKVEARARAIHATAGSTTRAQ